MTGRGGAHKTWGDTAPRFRSGRTRQLLLGAALAVAYYLTAKFGLSVSLVEHNATPLWPPTGIAVAAFLLAGRSLWPAVALAAFAVNLPISDGPLSAVVTVAGNTVAPLVAVTLLTRVSFRRQLDRRQDALAIVFLGALASMLISATIGAGTLFVSGAIPREDLLAAWAVWWAGDAMGVLAVTPFILSLPLFWEGASWPWRKWVEGVAILVVVGIVSAASTMAEDNILFMALPMLGWASWRLQLRGAAPAALIVTVVVTWAAASDRGVFEGGSLLEQMLTLQAFNACVALTSFFLAALVTERMDATEALSRAADEMEDQVRRRTAELSAANARLTREIRERGEAQEQLVRQEARAEKDHQVAETLQRSLLPDRLPQIPGVELAARYVPAATDVQIGGDWYDVMHLQNGLIGLAIGDVAGHGLKAATTMGQLRLALRAYALQDPDPVSVMRGLHQLVSRQPMHDMTTLIYLVFDPVTREVRFANAGHPPALVVDDIGSTYLSDGLAPPVGVASEEHVVEASAKLSPGATLLLYTDGLVERRGVSIQEGLDRLEREATGQASCDLEELCDRLLSLLLEGRRVDDDVALVAMRISDAPEPLTVTLPAEAKVLAQLRSGLRQWLRDCGLQDGEANEILIACGEACANVVQHAYGERSRSLGGEPALGTMEVDVRLAGEVVQVVVRDHGAWEPPAARGGGWGMPLMRSLMDTVEIQGGMDDADPAQRGTVVLMRRRVELGDAS